MLYLIIVRGHDDAEAMACGDKGRSSSTGARFLFLWTAVSTVAAGGSLDAEREECVSGRSSDETMDGGCFSSDSDAAVLPNTNRSN